jgi:hypothetical protein
MRLGLARLGLARRTNFGNPLGAPCRARRRLGDLDLFLCFLRGFTQAALFAGPLGHRLGDELDSRRGCRGGARALARLRFRVQRGHARLRQMG